MTEPGRVVAVEGPSGSGKSTLVRVAADAFGWTALAEAFDRLCPPPDLRFRNERELLSLERLLLDEEQRRYREATRRRRAGELVLMDTGFFGPVTYTAGLVSLGEAPWAALRSVRRLAERRVAPRGRVGLPDLILYLDLAPAERRHRAASDPTRHPRELRSRHEAVARFERRFYRELADQELSEWVRFVPAHGPPRRLAEQVRTVVQRSTSLYGRPARVSALFDRLERLTIDALRQRRAPVVRHR